MQFLTFIDPVPRQQHLWQLLFIINMAYDDGLLWFGLKLLVLVVGVGWDGPGGGGWGVNRACNCVFSVSHLFQFSCPS